MADMRSRIRGLEKAAQAQGKGDPIYVVVQYGDTSMSEEELERAKAEADSRSDQPGGIRVIWPPRH